MTALSLPADGSSNPETRRLAVPHLGKFDEMRHFVVDGEHFDVRERPSEPGVYDIAWTSGPNEGYGFASVSYDGQPQSDVELEEAIRSFLRQVDPNTGYID